MAWDNEAISATKVVAIKDGVERVFPFEGTALLKDVIRSVASQMSLGTVLVTADGRNVEPDEGSKPISEFQRIEVIPKNSGAAEEKDASDENEASEEDSSDDLDVYGKDSFED